MSSDPSSESPISVTPEPVRGSDVLAEARAQLEATGEILTAIGHAPSDVEGVFTAILHNAIRLCHADAALIYLLEGGVFQVAAAIGVSEDFRQYIRLHPIQPDRATVTGRVALDHRSHQIVDVLADPDYGRLDLLKSEGFRTLLGVPLMLDDEIVGVINLRRHDVAPFSDRAVTLMTTFATQAAIAIRNVDLVRALQARTSELDIKVGQLEALREVGQAVSSSLDLDEVLTTIVTLAVRLTETDGGSLLELDHGARVFRIRAAYGSSAELLEGLRETRISLDETLVGRACALGEPQLVPDLDQAPLDPHLTVLRAAGWRSVLAVPMQHEGEIVGALVVRRRTTGPFTADTSRLLQTFASQSALAIVNARLFGELERRTTELQVASRHKSEFLASMSHELRTPLNAVIGFSEVLLERMFGDINEKQEDYLRDILGSGRHLLELLNEILDLSKVESGHMQLEPSLFELHSALEYSLAQIRERATAGRITVDVDVDDRPIEVFTDELRFKQVVLNLLSNAVKFTPAEGHVTLRAVTAGANLTITVIDTGIGIAPEDRERIFESFEQAGRTRDQSEGTGLGLALCRRIVDLLNGHLWVESEVGMGSTFGFTIPIENPSSDALTTLSFGDDPVVVVVEDDHRSLELMALYLEGAGVHAITAADGAAGLAAVRAHRPNAVMLDLRLPGIDGWEVLSQLKNDPSTAATPVIVVSILDERRRAMSLGAFDYLNKPVGREQVVGALVAAGALNPPDEPGEEGVSRS